MADEHKSSSEQNARRVASWLAHNEAEFNQEGVNEDRLTSAVGLTREELAEAVDHLENREDVVRFPHPLATPPQAVIKPGRGWPDLRDEILAGESS